MLFAQLLGHGARRGREGLYVQCFRPTALRQCVLRRGLGPLRVWPWERLLPVWFWGQGSFRSLAPEDTLGAGLSGNRSKLTGAPGWGN